MDEKQVIADLHIHSRFSRACSKDLSIQNLEKYARIKGIDVLGTGDISHESWLKELKENLKESEREKGIFTTKTGFRFALSGEISLAYTQGRGRRVHLVYLAPDFEVNKQINDFLDKKGRRDYDGRPIFGFSCIEFAEEMMKISKDIEIIPAHCLTPWFGIFGSESGFDSLKEAFQDKADMIHAVESGMSASPDMLWRIQELNNKSAISFSDSHSFWPWRIGREATIFKKNEEKGFSYKELIRQVRESDFAATIETDPAYGKYHYDGHRLCKFSCSPAKSKELNGICPVCSKPLIIGVENRVERLAAFPAGFMPRNAKPFYKILPLHELIALAKASTLASKKTWQIYNQLIEKFGNEFNILLRAEKAELINSLPNDELLARLIMDNRMGNINVKPGYDGEYGIPMLKERQAKLV
ncbi:DNA helicase UvrD [Candidatus Pacearchaeota archaeon]|nr:DNA helicase UvrD [Candidatus Pacearchaeota archaeon]